MSAFPTMFPDPRRQCVSQTPRLVGEKAVNITAIHLHRFHPHLFLADCDDAALGGCLWISPPIWMFEQVLIAAAF